MDNKLKIILFTNDDPTSNILFHKLFSHPQTEILSVYFAAGVKSKETSLFISSLKLLKKMSKQYWLFLAIKNTLYKIYGLILRHIPTLSSKFMPIPNMKALCQASAIPYKNISNFNEDVFIKDIRQQKPDIIFARIPTILSSQILNVPQHGIWIVHSSLLPSFKGIAGEFHAMKENKPIGTTIFKAVEKLDEGPIMCQQQLINKYKSCCATILANNYMGSDLVIQSIEKLPQNNPYIERLPYEDSYRSWPTPDDMKIFSQTHHSLFSIKETHEILKINNPTSVIQTTQTME